MRLTLRTLLAYLDNVLDPADAEQLGAKIRDSEFATGLKGRIQSIVVKPRMGAPKIDAKGLTGDANNVAEYLDSSLPPDRVGDFERVCLESDVSLAEAAACHQILTLVLGKPADVPVGLRERVYALNMEPTVAVASAVSAAAGPAGATKPPPPPPPTDAELPTPPPVKPPLEVPDYLLAGRRSSFWPIAATVAAMLLLAVGVLRLLGPFDSQHPLVTALGLGAGGEQVAEAPNDPGLMVEQPPTQPGPAPIGEPNDASMDEDNPAMTRTDDERPVAPPGDVETPVNPPVDPIAGAPDAPPTEVEPMAPLPPALPLRPKSPDDLPNDPAVVGGPAAAMEEEAADAAQPPGEAPPAAVSGDVGRFVSDEHVLARFNAAAGLWQRLPTRALLTAGERLVALPSYRPQLALASGAQVTLIGETAIVLAPPREGRSVVLVDYGRLLVDSVGAAGAQIEFNLTGLKGVATLSDPDSSLAVEVRPYLPPGTNPEMPGTAAVPVVDLFAVRGSVVWQEEGQEPVVIPMNFGRTYIGATPPVTSGPFKAPDWTDSRSVSGFDRETSYALHELLSTEKPLTVALQEQLQDRRAEIRALSARSLVALDQFEPIIKELSDSRQYTFWFAELDTLRDALARGPESAAAVRESISRIRPEVSDELYRLLWNYSPEQLARGEAETLVKALESPDMDIRVVTFDNLRRITGALMLYRPERRVDQNKLAVQKWKERLKEGGIIYKVQPSPLPDRKPLDRMPPE